VENLATHTHSFDVRYCHDNAIDSSYHHPTTKIYNVVLGCSPHLTTTSAAIGIDTQRLTMQCKMKEETATSMSPFRADWITVSPMGQTRDREVTMDERSGTALNQHLKTTRTRPPTEDCPHP
jgi:hypothetical protein